MGNQKSKEEVVQEFRIQSLQDATLRVIARKGMAAATMQDIAEEAGVAKGTIYLYFRDREELVEKTFERAINQLMERIDKDLEGVAPFETKLRAINAAHLAFFRENQEFFRLYLSMRMPEGTPERQRRQKQTCGDQYRVRIQKFADLLKSAMDRGEIREMDPFRLALFIIEGSSALILQRLNELSHPPEEADVDLITTLILDGVRKRS